MIRHINVCMYVLTLNDDVCYHHSAQPPVKIEGEKVIAIGGRLELTCLLDDDRVPYNPQWQKNSENLPTHVTLVSVNL